MRSGLKLLAAIISIGAGAYLLAEHSAPVSIGGQSGQSWFETIAHGMGVYFIAKGVWMASFLGEAEYAIQYLDKIVQLLGHAHVRSTASDDASGQRKPIS